jgi:WD40 repeat protein
VTLHPYKGLASFDDSELDARLFFGRDAERETLVANLRASRLTVLYGASGVGKSSLLRAGVAQLLRGQGTTVVVHSTWIERPVDALIEAITSTAPSLGPTAGLADTVAAATGNGDVVLLLDQLEEYFLYHSANGPLVEALHGLLRRPGLRVSVLLAVRDDALAQLDAFSGRLPETFGNLLRLEPLGPSAAGEAIVKPLQTFADVTGEHVVAETSLVHTLQSEVADGLSAPFLQLVLDRVWEEERQNGSDELKLATLSRLGGSGRIAAAHVDSALDSIAADSRPVVSRVIRQLVTPSGTKIALGEADLAEYAGVRREELRPLLDQLSRDRILRAVDEIGDRGATYEIFHDVLAQPLLGWRQRVEVARARTGARRVAAAALAALVLVGAVAVYALVQRSSAKSEARRSHAHELVARAVGAVQSNPAVALRLGLQASTLSADQAAATVLRDALLTVRERHVLHLGGSATALIRGERLLAASTKGSWSIDDLHGRHLVTLPRQEGLGPIAWSTDGAVIATGSSDGTATLWDALTGRALRTVRTPAPIKVLQFDGHVLLVGSGGHLRLVYGTQGTTRTIRVGGAVDVAAFDSAKNVIAVAWKRAGHVTTQLIDVGSRRVLKTLPEKGITVVAFNSKGDLLATGSTDKTARVWRSAGALVHVLPQRGHITGLTWSSDGASLVSTSQDGTAAVWTVATGERELLLTGATGAANAAAIAPDGSDYAVAFADREARIYDGTDGRLLAPLAGHGDSVTSIAFDAAGTTIATGSVDGTIRLWDANPSDRLFATEPSIPPAPPAHVTSPDGHYVATRKGRDAYLTDAKTGRVVHVLAGHSSVVTDAEFSPDGHLLVTASLDHDARVWNVDTGRLVHVLRGHFFPVYAASFSPDGQWIVTASQFTAGVWNTATGQLVEYLRGAAKPLSNARFHDDSKIVARDQGGNGWQATCVVCQELPGLERTARTRLMRLR